MRKRYYKLLNETMLAILTLLKETLLTITELVSWFDERLAGFVQVATFPERFVVTEKHPIYANY